MKGNGDRSLPGMEAELKKLEEEKMQSSRTVNGMLKAEVVSMLQKAIRRGDEERAGFAAYLLMESGESWRCWRRLAVISAEDVGGLDTIAAVGQAQWLSKNVGGEKTMLAMRIAMELARRVRIEGGDRSADDYKCWLDEKFKRGETEDLPQIEDVDRDGHTKAGRAMGRGDGFFWRESSKLVNDSPYYFKGWLKDLRRWYEDKP